MKKSILAAAICAVAVLTWPAPVMALGTGPPPEVASTGVTVAQWEMVREEARRLANQARVSERALQAAAEATGARFASSGKFNALSLQSAVIEALGKQTEQLAELEARLERLTGDTDPGIAKLFTEARAALEAGRLREADRLLADVASRDLAGLKAADAETERLRLRAGETIASRGHLRLLQADYTDAAGFFARAALTVSDNAVAARWRYTHNEGVAHELHGDRFADLEALRRSVRVLQTALSLAQSEEDRARTQSEIASSSVRLADFGDLSALDGAKQAIAVAEQFYQRPGFERQLGMVQSYAGSAAANEFRNGDTSALIRSVRAFERATNGLDRAGAEDAAAGVRLSLAQAYLTWGKRDGNLTLIDASIIQARRMVSPAQSSVSDSLAAYAHMLIGVAYLARMDLSGPGSLDFAPMSEQAAAAFSAAESLLASSPGTAHWISLQNNIGNYFEYACGYHAHWGQDPMAYCKEAHRRYQLAAGAVPGDSSLARTAADNVSRLQQRITELDRIQ